METLYDKASLILNPGIYDTGKVYCTKPLDGSGDLTFTRASNATRVNAEGLVEKVRENLCRYSQDLSGAAWAPTAVTVTTNTTTAPDGTLTADTLEDSSGSYGQVRQTFSVSTAPYTFSFFLKKTTGALTHYPGAEIGAIGQYLIIDTTNGTGYRTSSIFSFSIVSYDANWWRVSLTANLTAGSISNGLWPAISSDGTSIDSAATGSNIFWGCQMEVSDFGPTDYIATTSAAVSVGPVSGLPRLDYSGGCPSLLLEPQRTNSLTYSEQFENAAWLKYQCSITSNNAISPDGTQNADKFTLSGGSGTYTGLVYRATSPLANSIYMKNDSIGSGKFIIQVDGVGSASWNSDGTLFSVSGGTATNAESVGSGWFRFTYVVTSGTYINFGIQNGTTGSSIYIWGAQLEAGSYATSYIGPTLGSAVTRLADFAYKTGVSSLFGASAGTFLMHFKYTAKKAQFGDYLFDITDSTNTNRFLAYCDGNVYTNQDSFVMYDSAVGGWGAVQFTYDQEYKLGIVYDSTSVRWYINGVYIGNGGAFPYQMSQIYLAVRYSLSSNLKIDLKETLIFPTALTATQLAELTTL